MVCICAMASCASAMRMVQICWPCGPLPTGVSCEKTVCRQRVSEETKNRTWTLITSSVAFVNRSTISPTCLRISGLL